MCREMISMIVRLDRDIFLGKVLPLIEIGGAARVGPGRPTCNLHTGPEKWVQNFTIHHQIPYSQVTDNREQ